MEKCMHKNADKKCRQKCRKKGNSRSTIFSMRPLRINFKEVAKHDRPVDWVRRGAVIYFRNGVNSLHGHGDGAMTRDRLQ
jgi:hypothetical protein